MILPYTKIIGLDIYELKNQSKVGSVKNIVIQKKDFRVLGIILENSFFDRTIRVVSGTDIVDISGQGVIIRDDNSVSSLKENFRIKEAIHDGLCGIDQKVVTKKGKSLGKVDDLFILTETLDIPKIFVKSLFSERIISSTAIVEIKKKKIIVKDSFESIRASAPEISTSMI